MTPRETTSETPPAGPQDARSELVALVRSLREQALELTASGAWGVPGAHHGAGPAGEAPGRAPVAAPPAAAPRSDAHEAAGEEPAAQATGGSPGGLRLPISTAPGLEALAERIRACTRCGLHQGRRQTVFARGTGGSGLCFIGEGPGEEEDRQGLPFVGPAGQLLDRMIAAMQLDRDDVYVCNVVKCRPPGNRKPEPDEMASCMPFLAEQLELIAPRVIVALGATAVQGLLGTTEGITRLRGNWKLYRGKIPVMPTFHPAYLLRTPSAKRDVWKDLQEVLKHLRAGG